MGVPREVIHKGPDERKIEVFEVNDYIKRHHIPREMSSALLRKHPASQFVKTAYNICENWHPADKSAIINYGVFYSPLSPFWPVSINLASPAGGKKHSQKNQGSYQEVFPNGLRK